jgi:Ca2+-binding RTX toxin-like protein
VVPGAPRDASGYQARSALAAALLAAAVLALALPSGAGADVTGISVNGVTTVTGSPQNDSTRFVLKFDGKGNLIFQISDPGGIADGFPDPPCERVDANTVVCPPELMRFFFYFGGLGRDEVIFDIPFFLPFAAAPAATPPQITANGGAGNDTIASIGPGVDTQIGGPGNDTLMGGGGNDSQKGGPGNDSLAGQAGNDSQRGGSGNDRLNGGKGKDRLLCQGGADKGTGGGGKDTEAGCEMGKP